jgi:hypothetical protein
MTLVVELRDLKKNLPRPVADLWRRAHGVVCALRVRLALFGLLCLALDWPVGGGAEASGGRLALLCGVLSAAMSATLGLLSDASVGLFALFSAETSQGSALGQTLSLCLGEPLFEACPESASFSAFSGHYLCALAACALFLFGCGFSRSEPASSNRSR